MGLLTETSRGCNRLVNPPGITARCFFSLVASLFVDDDDDNDNNNNNNNNNLFSIPEIHQS